MTNVGKICQELSGCARALLPQGLPGCGKMHSIALTLAGVTGVIGIIALLNPSTKLFVSAEFPMGKDVAPIDLSGITGNIEIVQVPIGLINTLKPSPIFRPSICMHRPVVPIDCKTGQELPMSRSERKDQFLRAYEEGVAECDFQKVEKMLDENPDSISLEEAVLSKDPSLVRFLISRGTKVDGADEEYLLQLAADLPFPELEGLLKESCVENRTGNPSSEMPIPSPAFPPVECKGEQDKAIPTDCETREKLPVTDGERRTFLEVFKRASAVKNFAKAHEMLDKDPKVITLSDAMVQDNASLLEFLICRGAKVNGMEGAFLYSSGVYFL